MVVGARLSEQPEWFDDRVKGMVLNDLVDDKEILKVLRALRTDGGGMNVNVHNHDICRYM